MYLTHISSFSVEKEQKMNTDGFREVPPVMYFTYFLAYPEHRAPKIATFVFVTFVTKRKKLVLSCGSWKEGGGHRS